MRSRREVTRRAGIPTSQQPARQGSTSAGQSYEYTVPKAGGGRQTKLVQEQNADRNHGPHFEAGDPKGGDPDPLGRPRIKNGKVKVVVNPKKKK